MTTHVAATRQPFAPLSSSRLQNLTSLKNCQNAITTTLTSPSKRKAEAFDFDSTLDSENIDPTHFLSPKRSKVLDGSSKDASNFIKPTNFFLTRAPASQSTLSSSPRRPILEARSPIKKLNTTTIRSSPLSAPAGRSPTRKRVGILNRRKTASPFTRIDPPKFAHSPSTSSLGFSIDAALSGTIPSYASRQLLSIPTPKLTEDLLPSTANSKSRDSWFFDIHEDTPEEEATNLMEHSTCTLDISSDEESAARARDERGKENMPPPDDVSQTRSLLTASSSSSSSGGDVAGEAKARVTWKERRKCEDEIEIDRSPLGDLAAEDFYAEGCDGTSVFLVTDEEGAVGEEVTVAAEPDAVLEQKAAAEAEPVVDAKGKGRELDIDVEVLMSKDPDTMAPRAALLEPIEKAEENFDLWESGSAKDGE